MPNQQLPVSTVPTFHHIGVQTSGLVNSTAWYEEFFGARESWSLTSFSELTRSRLPGISRLVELTIGDVRVHLFARASRTGFGESASEFQHVCIALVTGQALMIA
jgi:hypothetical protein